jgi:hypothetical protein
MPMTSGNAPTHGQVFELRIRGRLGAEGEKWFAGMEVIIDEIIDPVQTIIRGHVQDQAALHGLISRVGDLGLTLVSVNRIGGDELDE